MTETPDDQELTRRLAELRESYNVAGEPPLDAMWHRVETEAFAPGRPAAHRPGQGSWPLRRWLPLAAMLALGFGVGQILSPLAPFARLAGRPGPGAGQELAAAPQDEVLRGRLVSSDAAPFVGIASHYLEQVTALLVTLAGERPGGRLPEHTVTQARDLLATTRLLMDSPQRLDPALSDLLEDLELVLAQIVRLPQQPAVREVEFIDQALDQRDVIPRLRFLLADSRRPE